MFLYRHAEVTAKLVTTTNNVIRFPFLGEGDTTIFIYNESREAKGKASLRTDICENF